MVGIFGDSIGEDGPGNLQVERKVIVTDGKYVDYLDKIRATDNLGYPANRIAPDNNSPT